MLVSVCYALDFVISHIDTLFSQRWPTKWATCSWVSVKMVLSAVWVSIVWIYIWDIVIVIGDVLQLIGKVIIIFTVKPRVWIVVVLAMVEGLSITVLDGCYAWTLIGWLFHSLALQFVFEVLQLWLWFSISISGQFGNKHIGEPIKYVVWILRLLHHYCICGCRPEYFLRQHVCDVWKKWNYGDNYQANPSFLALHYETVLASDLRLEEFTDSWNVSN